MNPVQIGIGVLVVCIVLVLGWILYKRSTAPSPTPQSPGPEKDVVLKPIISAEVKAVKTGDDQKKVSGYSFDRREYDAGNCSFLPSMNRYVAMAVTLTTDGSDSKLTALSKVKAVWKVGGTEWSNAIVNVGGVPTNNSIDITILANTSNTSTNIACTDSVTDRNNNTIEIFYSTKLEPLVFRSTPWATLLIQSLGTAITTAFASITVGTGTPLVITLTNPTDTNVTVGSTQAIVYRLIPKGGTVTLINQIELVALDRTSNTYQLTYRKPETPVVVNVKTRTKAGTAFANLVAFQVTSNDQFNNQFVYFTDSALKTLSYSSTANDATFFRLEIDSQDCEYTWAATSNCSTSCGNGFQMERAVGISKAAIGAGQCAAAPYNTVPERISTTACNPQPAACPAPCVLGADGQIFKDIAITTPATCGTTGLKTQMKIVSEEINLGASCSTVYSAIPLVNRGPVTATAVIPMLSCTTFIKHSNTIISSIVNGATIYSNVDFFPSVTSASYFVPTTANVNNKFSRIEAVNFGSTTASSRTCYINLYNYNSIIASTPALPSISVSNVSPTMGNLCKVILTPKGQLKYAIKPNNTSTTWTEQATVILGPPGGGTPGIYTARIIEYTVPGAGTIITKLEIVSGTGGTVIATYPPW